MVVHVVVKLFGRYPELIGHKELQVHVKAGAAIWDVIEEVVKQYPSLRKDRKFMIVSQNNTFTTMQAQVSDGDVITLSPPIVGGG
jgi:molybdopterin converting factor small subunit